MVYLWSLNGKKNSPQLKGRNRCDASKNVSSFPTIDLSLCFDKHFHCIIDACASVEKVTQVKHFKASNSNHAITRTCLPEMSF